MPFRAGLRRVFEAGCMRIRIAENASKVSKQCVDTAEGGVCPQLSHDVADPSLRHESIKLGVMIVLS